MSENNTSYNGGIGFLGLLTVLFIGLKLTHFITWSWWWVLAPLWMGAAFFLAVLIVIFLIMLLVASR